MKGTVVYIFIFLMLWQKALGQSKLVNGIDECLTRSIKGGLIFKNVKQVQRLRINEYNIDSLTNAKSPISFFVFYCDTLNIERFKNSYFIGTTYNVYIYKLMIYGKTVICRVHDFVPLSTNAERDINFIQKFKSSCFEGGRITNRFYIRPKNCESRYIFIEFSRKSRFKMTTKDYAFENKIIEAFN